MQRYYSLLALAGSLMLAALCYSPGLKGGFVFDDNINIVENTALRMSSLDADSVKVAALSMGGGIAGRPLSMVTFAFNEYVGGVSPYGFKLTNLIIHLLNGIGIFILSLLLLEAHRSRHPLALSKERLRWISVAIATAWLLHPLNLTSVLYVVQRMTSLSALFTVAGLIVYLYGRQRQIEGKSGWGWILFAFLVFTPLAILCKENGALLPAFMLLTEVVLLNFQAPTARTRWLLGALFVVTVILPMVGVIVYSIFKPAWVLVGYQIRDFTLLERVMTEMRVLWFYLRLIVVPDIAQMGLQHDDIAISRGMLAPYWTLIAAAGLALLIGVAVFLRRRQPIAALGILFFLLGHSMESSVIALEIAHEHRNYLPIYGILLVMFYYLLSPVWHKDTLKLRQVLMPLLILFFGAVTMLRAEQWADPFGLAQMEVAHHPDSVRANTSLAYFYAELPAFSLAQAEGNYESAFSYYQKAAELSSTDMAGLFGMVGLNAGLGRPIDEQWVKELEYGLEHGPFAPDSVNSLMNLEKCLAKGVCTHTPQVMARLFDAALRNPTLRSRGRTSVQFARSNFLFTSLHDRDGALKAALNAVESTPDDPDSRITLIELLLSQGRSDEAARQIEKSRQRAEMRLHLNRLDELSNLATISGHNAR